MQHNQTKYSRLANITKLINSKLDLREVLEHVTNAISEEIVQCDAVGIFLPQKDGTFSGFDGKPKNMNGMTLESQVIDPKKDALARELIETKRTIYIPDTSMDNRPDPEPVEAFKIKSILGLPVSFEQELFGLVFLFDYGIAMNLTASEIQSVEAYVNMAAVAIRNTNDLIHKERLISEKQLLLDVTRALSKCSSIQECVQKCFFYLGKILDIENIGVHLLDPIANNSIEQVKFYQDRKEGWLEAWNQLRMDQRYEGLIQIVIKTKKPLIIPDVFSDVRLNHAICRKYALKGLIMIPMVSTDDVLGIISVVNLEDNELNYTESQLQLAESIVDAAAATLSGLLYMYKLENLIEKRTNELTNANEKNSKVIESITDGFMVLNKEWQITYLNKHLFSSLFKNQTDLINKNFWQIFPYTIDTSLYEQCHKAMLERVSVHLEYQSPKTDNWYEIVAYPYEDGISSLIKDITEKKKYEMELKRLSGLELIGQMAAGISHEIRNPMTTVRGFLQFMNEDETVGKFKNYIDLMIEELDRANIIISEFLSMSKTRISKLQKLDLNLIIHDMAPLIHVDALNQNKHLKLDTGEIPELALNRNEIRQLIMNLYRNGLEAMGEGKVLTIRTYAEDDCVVLAIQDEGEGIKPEVLEMLGTPFFTTKEKGTGLGLGVSYAIAARHNAKIEVQTGQNGTTFFVKFYH